MYFQDYVHACDRLSALKFNETQQRDFVRVALHCCGVVSSIAGDLITYTQPWT